MKKWIIAARLKTLPLAIAGPMIAVGVANNAGYKVNIISAVLCVLVALVLQVISNYANDLGDFIKGTDQAANRKDRALTAGLITQHEMKWAIAYLSLIAIIIGVCLISLEISNLQDAAILFGIGLLGILAAITYTLGKKAYGYLGLGDIFVFIFFGLVSVLGSYYVLCKEIDTLAIYAACAIGCFAAGVLHMNNMRDLEKDKLHHKNTLATKIGFSNGRIYHIINMGIGSFFIIQLMFQSMNIFLGIPLILFIIILATFLNLKQTEFEAFNLQLKWTSLNTFLIALIIFIESLW